MDGWHCPRPGWFPLFREVLRSAVDGKWLLRHSNKSAFYINYYSQPTSIRNLSSVEYIVLSLLSDILTKREPISELVFVERKALSAGLDIVIDLYVWGVNSRIKTASKFHQAIVFNNPLKGSLKRRFHAGQICWYSVCVKCSFSLQCCRPGS